MKIKLYQSPMSSASPVVWAMAELGLDHESIQIDLKGTAHKQAEFLAMNPMGQVPTLVRDGQAMFESSAIVIFLGDTYGVERGLWPAVGSDGHMVALTWVAWLAATMGGTLRKVFANTPEWNDAAMCHEGQLAQAREQVGELLRVFDGHLEGRQYITGEQFTLADAYVGATLAWVTGNLGFDTAPTPHLGAWLGRCLAREGAKAMMAGS